MSQQDEELSQESAKKRKNMDGTETMEDDSSRDRESLKLSQSCEHVVADDDESKGDEDDVHEAEAETAGDLPPLSPATAEAIDAIQGKMEEFAQQIQNLLDSGRQAVDACLATWEQSVVEVYQARVSKWNEQIQALEAIDHTNTNLQRRLSHAQSVFDLINPAKPMLVELPDASKESLQAQADAAHDPGASHDTGGCLVPISRDEGLATAEEQCRDALAISS